MILATEYTIADEASVPVVQTLFKTNLETLSKGRLSVDLNPGGRLGLGGALAQKVQSGAIQAAQYSLANLTPYVPIVDVVNIPYWCGDNQRFANLVTSRAWARAVNPSLEARGFKALFYYTEDPRTIAKSRSLAGGSARTPGDIRGVKIRVPGSAAMKKFYELGAVPTMVAWGETLAALRAGTVDALDPAATTLYAAGYRDVLSSISFIAAVPDAQVYACNLNWFSGLPAEVQRAVEEASEQTMAASFAALPGCRHHAMKCLAGAGVSVDKLSSDELAEWRDATGEERSDWNDFKADLAGSLAAFDTLKTAASTKGRYTVDDY